MQEITPFRICWNAWNGFILQILYIEANIGKRYIDGSIFSVNFSKSFLTIDLFFIKFEVKKPIIKQL